MTVLLVVANAACASSAVDSAGRKDRGSAEPSAHANNPQYDVHEWGLVRADQGDTIRIGAVAPPIPPEMLIMDKPVLYFLADAPMTLKQVLVSAPLGNIVETWPLADKGADEHTMVWSNVSIDPTSACPFSPLPRKTDPPCSRLAKNDECESLGLAAVRTVDASCVRVGDKTESFLFYRAATASLTPPLRFVREANGSVRVTNEGDEPIPGLLVRIETTDMQTKTLSAKPPPPHEATVVGIDFPSESNAVPGEEDESDRLPRARVVKGPARADIRSTIHTLGLSDTEADAFMKTWDETLFGSPSRGGFRPIQTGTSFIYFLPEPTVERAVKVSFDPPPRAFRRAFAVWVRLADR